ERPPPVGKRGPADAPLAVAGDGSGLSSTRFSDMHRETPDLVGSDGAAHPARIHPGAPGVLRAVDRRNLVRLLKLTKPTVVRYPSHLPPSDPATEQSVRHPAALLGRAGQEVEVAALIGLEDVVDVQPAVAAGVARR